MADNETVPELPAEATREPWDVTFAHMWEMVFKPELQKRRAAGLIGDDFQLCLAQLLQPSEGENKVFLNEEVQGVITVLAPRSVKAGQHALLSDLEDIEQFDLPDELLDCGHFTIIRAGKGWRMIFNFLSGRAKARDMLELAAQFLEAAETSGIKGHAGPAVDNLFSAAELISKAELILHRSNAVKSKTHGVIASQINDWARLGNIDAAFVALFNKLSRQRPNARYSDRDHRPEAPDAESFGLVRAMIDRGFDRVARSTDRNRAGR